MSVSSYLDQSLQLCRPSKDVAFGIDAAIELLERDGYWFELKMDGIRCMALIDHGYVQLINRGRDGGPGSDISYRYPDVVDKLSETFKDAELVLDGELVCYRPDGMPDFSAAHRRDAQSRAVPSLIAKHPATLMAFDILYFEGSDIRPWSWQARNRLLRTQCDGPMTSGVQWSTATPHGETMWNFVREHGLEGLVAKNPKASYRPGRSNGWYKIKQAFHVSCVVVGMTPGKGRREDTFGSLELGLLEADGNILRFGEVGTGFTARDLTLVRSRVDHALAGGGPFVVDIEINGVTPDRKPRHPSYRGIRQDISPVECTVAQLEAVPVI